MFYHDHYKIILSGMLCTHSIIVLLESFESILHYTSSLEAILYNRVILLQVVVKADEPPSPKRLHYRHSEINRSMFHTLVHLLLDCTSIPPLKFVAHELLN